MGSEEMSVLTRIESLGEEFSAAERKLANYIQCHVELIPTMTANELAEAAGSSAPTVVRFSKKIGYSSLTEFKIALSTELQVGSADEFSEIGPNESFYSIKNKLGKNAQIAIEETVDILSEETVMNVVQLLEKAETIYLYGVVASSLVVEDILQKWSRIGKKVIYEENVHVLLPQLIHAKESDVLWLVSNSGKTNDVVALAETVQELPLATLALTQLGNNPLSKMVDVSIQTSRPKELAYRSAATNSLLAQFITVDILFYVYMSRNEELAEKVIATRASLDVYFDQLRKG